MWKILAIVSLETSLGTHSLPSFWNSNDRHTRHICYCSPHFWFSRYSFSIYFLFAYSLWAISIVLSSSLPFLFLCHMCFINESVTDFNFFHYCILLVLRFLVFSLLEFSPFFCFSCTAIYSLKHFLIAVLKALWIIPTYVSTCYCHQLIIFAHLDWIFFCFRCNEWVLIVFWAFTGLCCKTLGAI
jgi:hypothetical protein